VSSCTVHDQVRFDHHSRGMHSQLQPVAKLGGDSTPPEFPWLGPRIGVQDIAK
jgi:hypothetical protein